MYSGGTLIYTMRQDAYLQIEARVKQLLHSELNVNASVMATSTSSTPLLGRGVGLDSVETMALVLSIEEEFGISVPDSDMTATLFETIGTLTDYVLHKLSESKEAAKKCEQDGQV
jgi:acyl carrier protein